MFRYTYKTIRNIKTNLLNPLRPETFFFVRYNDNDNDNDNENHNDNANNSISFTKCITDWNNNEKNLFRAIKLSQKVILTINKNVPLLGTNYL